MKTRPKLNVTLRRDHPMKTQVSYDMRRRESSTAESD